LKFVARLVIAGGLTAYILWRSDPRAVVEVARGGRWELIAVAALLVLADRALMAYRWVALLCTVDTDRRPPLAALMRVFFVSTFVGTFLPTSVGGDAVRSYSTIKLNVPAGDALASVVMDRVLGVASLLLMTLVGLLFARQLLANAAVLAALAATGGLCLVALLLIFHRGTGRAMTTVLSQIPGARVRTAGTRALESIRKYAAYPQVLLGVLAGSVGVQILRIVQAYFLGRSLDITAPLSLYFAFIPLILIVMLLPITVNGIGTSQVAFVGFFAQAAVPEAAAFALSVLFVALNVVGNLPGALLYLSGSKQEAVSETPDPLR
jgi:uncharacterized protein (TIRG00374 family)